MAQSLVNGSVLLGVDSLSAISRKSRMRHMTAGDILRRLPNGADRSFSINAEPLSTVFMPGEQPMRRYFDKLCLRLHWLKMDHADGSAAITL